MPNKTKKIVIPILVSLLFTLLLFLINYTSGTFLSGWDNLQTSFNPALGIKRAFFAVWQEGQSFGVVSGMAHAADLVRSLFVWALSIFLPVNIIRYVVHFFLVFVGFLGAYFLFDFLGFRGKEQAFSYVGAFLYILSFPNIQNMALPHESFSFFLAFLPWQIYIFLKFIREKSFLKGATALFVINLLATPQAFVQTLFVVYFIVLGFFFLGELLKGKSWNVVKKGVFAFLTIILINSFWILPQIYFLSKNTDVITHSKINQVATGDLIAKNFVRGDFMSFVKGIGLYFDSITVEGELVMDGWGAHFNDPLVISFQIGLFCIAVLGLFNRKKFHLGFLLAFLFLSIVLMTGVPFISTINSAIRSNALLNQIFRSPFTKFASLYALVISYLFISGVTLLLGISNFGKKAYTLFGLVFILLAGYLALPAFKGHYLSSTVRVVYPEKYFELQEYFSEHVDPDARVVSLPDASFWGWYKYDWGYEGSGFLWYMLPQAVVSRTFDVWSFPSESFYWELSYALELEDTTLIESVLKKYAIDYIIVDPSITPLSSTALGIDYPGLFTSLSSLSTFEEVYMPGNFGVYRNVAEINNEIEGATNIGPVFNVTNLDRAHLDEGDYISDPTTDEVYFYPFATLFSQTELVDSNWAISEDETNFYVEVFSKKSLSGFSVELPDEGLLQAKYFLGEEVTNVVLEPSVEFGEDFLKITIPKELVESIDPMGAEVAECGISGGNITYEFFDESIELVSRDGGVACFGYSSPLLAHWNGYLVKLSTDNIFGLPLFFYSLGVNDSGTSSIERKLKSGDNYMIFPNGNVLEDSYTFSFQNSSLEGLNSSNILSALEIYIFPYEYIKNIRLVRNGGDQQGIQDSSTVVFWQAYEDGWLALCGNKLCDARHVLVNNWASGWVFDDGEVPEDINIVFWPQLLEYLGFILLGLTFVYVTTATKKLPKRD